MKRIGTFITALALALLAAACGGDVGNAGPLTQPPTDQSTTTVPTTVPGTDPPVDTTQPPVTAPVDAVDQQFVELFFGKDGFAVGVVRAVDTPAVATNAIQALIAGPSEADSFSPRHRGEKVRVIKGGSYLCAPDYCMRYRPAARHAQETGTGTSHIGFGTVFNGRGPKS